MPIPILPTILTQDHRCTADVVFEVRVHERVFGVEDDYEEGHVWIETESGDHAEASRSWSRKLDARLYNGDYDRIPDKWRRIGYKNIEQVVTTCFTEEGAKAYLAANGHNLQHAYGKPFIYGASLWRNREMLSIREALIQAAEAVKVANGASVVPDIEAVGYADTVWMEGAVMGFKDERVCQGRACIALVSPAQRPLMRKGRSGAWQRDHLLWIAIPEGEEGKANDFLRNHEGRPCRVTYQKVFPLPTLVSYEFLEAIP